MGRCCSVQCSQKVHVLKKCTRATTLVRVGSAVSPKVLKGFRDLLPDEEIERALLVEKLTVALRQMGFVPIDTPALEYTEVLLRKSEGDTEKQMFRFVDKGGRDVALRFDLTVPLARFVATHYARLYFPFKRYHFAKVWRGEKPQMGRYREFTQCDFDIVGSDSVCADFEILKSIRHMLYMAGAEHIRIHVAHRGLFDRFLRALSLSDQAEHILRIIDKRAKMAPHVLTAQLESLCDPVRVQKIMTYVSAGEVDGVAPSFEHTLSAIETLTGGVSEESTRLRKIYELLCAVNIQSSYVFDPSITRGFDYYTGMVCETFLTQLPHIGSVCSGGRYDHLTALYMKDAVSGVGASIGLDRLYAAFQQLGMSREHVCFVQALIFCQDSALMDVYQKLCSYFAVQVATEVFPDPRKLSQQYAFAEKKGIRWGIFVEQRNAVVEIGRAHV